MAEILGLFPHEAEQALKGHSEGKNEVTSESSRETQSYFYWEIFLPPGRQEKWNLFFFPLEVQNQKGRGPESKDLEQFKKPSLEKF